MLLASLLFYAWGEVFYLGLMLISIIANYSCGLYIHRSLLENENPNRAKLFLIIAIIINAGLLVSFKYVNFISDSLNILLLAVNLPRINIDPVHLPLGISFFTFQAISYVVDIYRKEVKPQTRIINLALYISLFPQLIAGPIVRYHDVATQITRRLHSVELFASGVKKFIFGLAKKMLIANPLGEVVDNVFALSGSDLTTPLAWIGILAYTLQIYFDFSGYSDMAIGLGRMFGFRFLENFNYPYIAKSLREFWRRWHISLSSWFRDYVYIPLGGSKVSSSRVYINLFIVFILTGVWHGASWNFIIWGLFHGAFLTFERIGLSSLLSKLWEPLQHIYLLFVVIIGWVFFRAETLPESFQYLKTMFSFSEFKMTLFQLNQVLSAEAIYAFSIGIFLATPFYLFLSNKLKIIALNRTLMTIVILEFSKTISLFLLFYVSILKVASSTYNPFIYFRF